MPDTSGTELQKPYKSLLFLRFFRFSESVWGCLMAKSRKRLSPITATGTEYFSLTFGYVITISNALQFSTSRSGTNSIFIF